MTNLFQFTISKLKFHFIVFQSIFKLLAIAERNCNGNVDRSNNLLSQFQLPSNFQLKNK